jgi:competence protein ComEC
MSLVPLGEQRCGICLWLNQIIPAMMVAMTLLYLALAYMAGIALGRLAWSTGWLDCTWPTGLWLLPLALLLLLPTLNQLPWFRPRPVPLRWPQAAGFEPPQRGPSPALMIAIGFCILIGALRYASHPLDPCRTPADLAYYNLSADQAFNRAAPLVAIIGYVNSYPLVADTKQRVEIVAQELERDGQVHSVIGVLRLNTGIRQLYEYGQPVRVVGRLVTPPEFEDFSYREYLARHGIHSLLYSARIEPLPASNQGQPLLRLLYALRARGESMINRALPEPYAALSNGMLLGIEAGIPDTLYDQFNLTGSSHIIVISGSNVALLIGLVIGVTQRLLGRRRVLWPALAAIASYALLVGGDAAVLRAAMMGGLLVVATVLNRRSTALVSLAFACWVMTLVNPLALWDVGFQLSSAATAGLILFNPGLQKFLQRMWHKGDHQRLPEIYESALGNALATNKGLVRGLLEEGLVTTLAANITTLPLVVYYFGRLSLVSLGTNLGILPVQPLVMLSGSLGVVLGWLGAELPARVVFWFTWLGLAWTVGVVERTASLPGASLSIAGYGLGGLVITYLLIFALRWRMALFGRLGSFVQLDWHNWQRRLIGSSLTVGVGACALLLWTAVGSLPDGRLQVYFLDVGQGDGIFIQTPSGRQVLIDGGPSPEQLLNELGEVMPFWDRTIDLVTVTNPDKDHMDAQAQASTRFQITTALQTAATVANHDADLWRANVTSAGADLQLQHRGGWIDLGDGVALWVLWPPAELFTRDQADEQFFDNENSLVMKLTYGDFSVLLTGDVGLSAEMGMLAAGAPVQATVLKVGHHGSRGSTSATFLQAVNPQVAVIQVGAENDYGHPHAEVLDNLAGHTVLRNDLHGRIHLFSDGQQMWIETQTNPPLMR